MIRTLLVGNRRNQWIGRTLWRQATTTRLCHPAGVVVLHCPSAAITPSSWQRGITTMASARRARSRNYSAMMEEDDEDEDEDDNGVDDSYEPAMWANGYVDYLGYLELTKNYAAVQHDVSQKTVPQLKDLLRERKLKVMGRKAELQERLLDDYGKYNFQSKRNNDNSLDYGFDSASDDDDDDSASDDEAQRSARRHGTMSLAEAAEKPPPVKATNEPIFYCFDTANNYRLVGRHVLEQQGRMQDAMTATATVTPAVQQEEDHDGDDVDAATPTVPITVHEAQSLIDLLPPEMVSESSSLSADLIPHLMEIVLDVGKRPFAWVHGERHFLSSDLVTREQLQHIIEPMQFGPDNRAGINGSLHRISAIRNREGECIGLTLRVGRFVPGNALMIADVLAGMPGASILVVGEPGSGKTSIIRDAARFLSEQHSLLIIDTSCEIGGSGDVPHECIGLSRRMQVKNIQSQASVMIECVQNHTPAVMVIDEIGREAEVQAALTCKERGVRIIASAHGNLSGLVRNASLCDLVGGVDVVTVGDAAAQKEAKRRGQKNDGIASKLNAQRRGPPIFDVIIELKRGYLHEWHVVLNCASAVDSILSNGKYSAQARYRENSGASAIQTRNISKNANALDEIREKGFRQDNSLVNSIPMMNMEDEDDESDAYDTPKQLDPYSQKCKTCPSCNRTFASRKGFIQHAINKRNCIKKFPQEFLQFLTEAEHYI